MKLIEKINTKNIDILIPTITTVGVPLAGTTQRSEQLTTISSSRAQRYSRGNDMDSGDIAAILDAVVEYGFTFNDSYSTDCFKLADKAMITKNAKVKQIDVKSSTNILLETVIKKTGLQFKLKEYIRDILKYGEIFIELIVDPKLGIITGIQSYHPSSMLVIRDPSISIPDQAASPKPISKYRQLGLGNRTLHEWDFWQIIHPRWKENDRYDYATKSFLDDIYDDWLNLKKLEKSLVLMRLARAEPRLIHNIDVTDQNTEQSMGTFRTYIRNFTKASNENKDGKYIPAAEDIYLTKRYLQSGDNAIADLGKIDFYDPQLAGLGHIDDILYARRKLFSIVPASIVGIENNRDITAQDITFANMIRKVQLVAKQIITRIFDVQLILSNQLIEGNPDVYELVFPFVKTQNDWKFAYAAYQRTLQNVAMIENQVLSREFVFKQLTNGTTEDYKTVQIQIENENNIYNPIISNSTNAGAKGGSAAPLDTTNANAADQINQVK